ncbi:MAG: hypothetical protein NZM12_11870, partial [Steroidobacteraceae bacterium]|nr:hypothetical protein [Steroidobacteraceae bacterium]MDW8257829.1 hypothetical protein [Gammaproteobacteria bacterium]
MRLRPQPLSADTAHGERARRLRAIAAALMLAALIIVANGCGSGSADGPNSGSIASASGNGQDRAIAERLYTGTPRTPEGFYSEHRPAGVSGTIATWHLKSTDLGPQPATAPSYELCSDDLAQATAWSEHRATFQGGYADLVEIAGNLRFWELIRVPRADVNSRLRHRVFKCSYVDRATTDLAAPNGAAGTLHWRPLDAAVLRELVEYLWHFTAFNNADHIVLSSTPGPSDAATLQHAIEMARLTRAPHAGGCDRVDLLRWTHSAAV